MKNFSIAVRGLLILSLLTGGIYPLSVTLLGQWVFASKANGSLIVKEGKIIGSELIAQSFKDPKYFWARPSAVDYNPLPSGGSNLSPSSGQLLEKIEQRRREGYEADLLFTSASGLDPHISLEAALSQIDRISKARNLTREFLSELIDEHLEDRQWGFIGMPRVNVLKLNLALEGAL